MMDARRPTPETRSQKCGRGRNLVLAVVLASIATVGSSVTPACGQGVGDGRQIRGVVRAVRQATISSEFALRTIDVPFREGDSFKRGDLLIAFDCRRQTAEHNAAAAAYRESTLNLESNVFLDRHNAVGKNDVEISRARSAKTLAEMQSLHARLEDCSFKAPFDGRIVELTVRVHERTVPQRAFLSIIDDSNLEIEAIVSSAMLSAIAPGVAFSFKLDELGGRSVDAEIASIAAVVDPISKTVKVIGVIKERAAGILAGMSGTAHFKSGK